MIYEPWKSLRPEDRSVCIHCGRPIYYSAEDTVWLHYDFKYYCDESMKTSAERKINGRKQCTKCGWKTNILFNGMCYDCAYPEEYEDDEIGLL